MPNLTDTVLFKKLNSETAMYDADAVDRLVGDATSGCGQRIDELSGCISANYALKSNVYTKDEIDSQFRTLYVYDESSNLYHRLVLETNEFGAKVLAVEQEGISK